MKIPKTYLKGYLLKIFLTACLCLAIQNAWAQETSLYRSFVKPPASARPHLWWHWMNGNITKDGIYKDLMWMHRIGIGGFHHFDAGLETPQIVEKRLEYMTPEWKDAFSYAVHLADSLGMEMAVASSPGWSSTGGPWVTPEQAMKKLVWREQDVKGGTTYRGMLPPPYTATGYFQNFNSSVHAPFVSGNEVTYYKDIAVVAVKCLPTDRPMASLGTIATTRDGTISLRTLTDGDLTTAIQLPRDDQRGYAWIQYTFNQPQTIRALSIVDGRFRNEWASVPADVNKHLLVSNDGVNFQKVCDIPSGGASQQTITIPPTRARFFRILFDNVAKQRVTEVAELQLYTVDRVNHAEEKAGFATPPDLELYPTPADAQATPLDDVVVLTDKVDSTGRLVWKVPQGNWRIYRFGYSLTGKKNHPASPEATGLEVDKLDAQAVHDYLNYYLSTYDDASNHMLGKSGLRSMLIDSYESGWETWTPKMAQEFEHRRGYSLLKWLPVLTGQIVGSADRSERFLWDWRKTIGELITENLYAQVDSILATRGMSTYYETHENGRLYLADGMEAKSKGDVPMAAMWCQPTDAATTLMSESDIRESASVAHLYGKPIVAAESMTANGLYSGAYVFYPGNLKPVADLEIANGVNRFFIQECTHQPVDDKRPGLGLMIYGPWFNRHNTWAEWAKPWTDYLARSSYMMQQGHSVADILYYYGEDNNITGLFAHVHPDIPTGYNFDYVNATALTRLIKFRNGKLTAPSGMQYRLLVLDKNARKMSLPVLQAIARLAREGALICGQVPEWMPSLTGDSLEFNRLVREIFHSARPNVYNYASATDVLKANGIRPDVVVSERQPVEGPATDWRYVHRSTDNAEIYWFNNRTDRSRSLTVTCRTVGMKPRLWHPETGTTEELSYRVNGNETTIYVNMVPNDAVFIVFQGVAQPTEQLLPARHATPVCRIETDWQVTFRDNMPAEKTLVMPRLQSYTEQSDPDIKYYSGSAVYRNRFRLSSAPLKGARYILNLGNVGCMAQVTVNGRRQAILWKAPYTVDVTNALRKGDNRIEVEVVNLWANRLIGDCQPDTPKRYTYTGFPFYKANSPLLPSGLMGPVELSFER